MIFYLHKPTFPSTSQHIKISRQINLKEYINLLHIYCLSMQYAVNIHIYHIYHIVLVTFSQVFYSLQEWEQSRKYQLAWGNKFNNLSFIDFYFVLAKHCTVHSFFFVIHASIRCFFILSFGLLLMLQQRGSARLGDALWGLIKICQMQIMRININKLHANQQINMSHKTICGPMPATLIMLPLTRRLPCIASNSPYPFPPSPAYTLFLLSICRCRPKVASVINIASSAWGRRVNIVFIYKKKKKNRAHIGPQGASGRGVSHLRQMQNNCIFIWAIGAERRAVPCQPARHCCSSCYCRCCSECCWDHKHKSALRRPLMTFPKCANKQHDWRQRCSQREFKANECLVPELGPENWAYSFLYLAWVKRKLAARTKWKKISWNWKLD